VIGKSDLVAQFRQTCENIRDIVCDAGGEMSDAIKLTMFVLDVGDCTLKWEAIGAVYREYVSKHFPPMTLIARARPLSVVGGTPHRDRGASRRPLKDDARYASRPPPGFVRRRNHMIFLTKSR
jgi:Endoribonuclease L-PSP